MSASRLLAALLVVFLGAPPAAPQGFAGLGSDAGGFAAVTPGTPIAFPADYGAHPEHRIEWWYITANLVGPDRTPYGIQWTLFRQALEPGPQRDGWASQQVYLGHAAVTGADFHHVAETRARGGIGQAGVTAAPFSATIDDWELSAAPGSPGDLSVLDLAAAGDAFSYRLRLETDAAPVLQGDAGYSLKSEAGQASHYYSQPFFSVAGTLVVEGTEIAVTGRAWMDREWSSQPLAEDQEGWDWFSLHLAGGEKLMVFQLRDRDGGAFTSGTLIAADGTPTQLGAADIALQPGGTVDVAGHPIPRSWHLALPSRGLDVTVTPLNVASLMTTSIVYWEGPVTVSGSTTGVGYLEMTGR